MSHILVKFVLKKDTNKTKQNRKKGKHISLFRINPYLQSCGD